MNLYFTYEPRDTLTSFTLKTAVNGTQRKIRNMNFNNYRSWFTFSTQRRIWSFVILVLQTDTMKKSNKKYIAHAQLSFRSLNLLFSDVPVANRHR